MFLLLTSPLCTFDYYNGVLEVYVRPYRNDLQGKNRIDLSEYIGMPRDTYSPLVIKEAENSLGEGFDMYHTGRHAHEKNIPYMVAEKILKRTLQGVNGVFAYYRGYGLITDSDGLISFPRLEQENKILIVVTKDIFPVITGGIIPTYFCVHDISQTGWYECIGEENDDGTMMTWKVVPYSAVPSDGKIPENALIIISDPMTLFFENSRTVAFSQNFLIPDILVTENFTRGIYAMHALEVLRYYGTMQWIEKESVGALGLHFAKKMKGYE